MKSIEQIEKEIEIINQKQFDLDNYRQKLCEIRNRLEEECQPVKTNTLSAPTYYPLRQRLQKEFEAYNFALEDCMECAQAPNTY